MRDRLKLLGIVSALMFAVNSPVALAQPAPMKDGAAAAMAGGIPAGTTITTENWQQYRDFMSEGQQALFAGEVFLEDAAHGSD